VALVIGFGLGGLGLISCDAPTGAVPGAGAAPSGVGSVSFELTLGGKYHFDTLSYDIGGNGFHRADSINVSGSSSISAVVSGIPTGHGYVASLRAQDTAGKLTPCTGSATFDVASAATVAVPVHMSCSVVQQTTTGSGGTGGTGAGGAGGGGGSPPPPVPIPRSATYALAALLAILGAGGLRLSLRR
jgi:hypothetical protein